jgi:hypothetical protein
MKHAHTTLGSILFLGLVAAGCVTEDIDDGSDTVIHRNTPSDETQALMLAKEFKNTFKTTDDALAAGYGEATPCLEGLGAHYVDLENFLDCDIDVNNPETLRYAPNEDGEMKLIAVEYSSTTDCPKPDPLLGQEFEGLASTGLEGIPPIWFLTISVLNNPDGIFTLFNPEVACRGTGIALGFAPCPEDPEVMCLVPSTCEELGLTACVEWEQSQE